MGLEPYWEIARVMILLGDKYDVSQFRTEGIRLLKARYPRDMAEWDEQLPSLFFDRPEDHIAVAHATRTLEDPDLHAVALYNCCGLSASMLLFGDLRSDDPLALCMDDLTRCLEFQQAMPKHWSDLHYELLEHVQDLDASECLGPNVCRPTIEELRGVADEHVRLKLDSDTYHFFDLTSWEDLLDTLDSIGLCKPCISAHEKQLLHLRQGFRNRLTRYFGCVVSLFRYPITLLSSYFGLEC